MSLVQPTLGVALRVTVVLGLLGLSSGCTRFEPNPEAQDTSNLDDEGDAGADGGLADVQEHDSSDGEDQEDANAPDSLADVAPPGRDTEGQDADPGQGDVDVMGSDVATDIVEHADSGDAIGPTDSDIEQGEDAQPTPDVDASVPPPCVDLCPAEGIFRCMDGVIAATERCTTDTETGCLFWDPFEVCQDNQCKGQAFCNNGICDHEGDAFLDCPAPEPCMASVCDAESETCVQTPLPGGGCDDGEVCTSLDTCDESGACVGTPDASLCPCSNDSDCLDNDPDGEACEDRYLCQPISEGSPASACVYSAAPTTCEPEPSGCTTASCIPETGTCGATPVEEGTVCDDSDPCTKNEKCDGSGQCSGFPDAVTCECESHADCLAFDEDGDACNGRYACTDLGWASGAMACVYEPTPLSCPEPDSECLTGACVPATGECIDLPVTDGQPCDDGDLCSASSSCLFGLCTGAELVTCLPGEPCDNVACDPATGSCFVESIEDSCCGNGILEEGEACDTPASWCTKECAETACVPGSLAVGMGCLQFPTGQGVLGATFTVDFYIRVAGDQGTVLASGQGINAPWRLALEPGNGGPTLVWRETPMTAGAQDGVEGPTLTAGQWHHVTVTRDATAPSFAQVSFWLDAVEAGSGTLASFPLSHADWNWLGCQAGGDQFLPALIDEFRWREGVQAPTPPPSEPAPADNALLLYRFDDVTPGVAVDASGWGRHGAWQGCLRADETPFEGQSGACNTAWCNRSALLFDPNQEGVGMIPASLATSGLSSLTVEFYLRLDSTVETQMVLSQSSNEVGGPDWHIQAVNGGGNLARLQWYEGQETGALLQLDNFVTSSLLTSNITHHVAFVRSVDEAGEVTARWYIDGQPGSLTTLQSPKGFELNSLPIYVGSQAGSTAFLDGFLDELRISNAPMYTDAPFTPGVIQETPETLGLYRFDIGAGSWAYPELWGALPPMMLEGVSYAIAGATAAGPCP